MPLSASTNTALASSSIPISKTFKYLGIQIFPSLQTISKENYSSLFTTIRQDLQRWDVILVSLQGRIAIIKMNILPRLLFLFSMIPLSRRITFFKEMNSLLTKFIWNKKRPRIKLSTLQRRSDKGGLSLPNLQLYFWACQLRSLKIWLQVDSQIAWRDMEASVVLPHRLQDILFTGLSKKDLRSGNTIVCSSLKIWREVCKFMGSSSKFTSESPIWHNHHLQSDNRPFVFKPWSDQSVYTLGDIFNNQGLRSFQDLKECYNLPGHSYFLYLRLRSAMCAYGVPWNCNLDSHPLMDCVNFSQTRGAVSFIYNRLLKHSCGKLPITTIWEKELAPCKLNWDWIWDTIPTMSKNLAHQLIHYKMLHRAYATPNILHKMKRLPTPFCSLCNSNTVGTYMHMFYECQQIGNFWDEVFQVVTELCDKVILKHPSLCLLNDDADLDLNVSQRRILHTALTAAKKIIFKIWHEPTIPAGKLWLIEIKYIALLELTTARINKAKPKTLKAWTEFVTKLSYIITQ